MKICTTSITPVSDHPLPTFDRLSLAAPAQGDRIGLY